MIVLDATTRKLQVKMDGMFTFDSPIVASWDDITASAFTPGAGQTITNGATAVDAIAAPAASTQRVVKFLSISNADLAARVATIIYNDNATLRNVLVATLQIGDTITYANGIWTQTTSAGKITANFVYAGPTSGSAQAPTFRALVAADIPSVTQAMLASKNREFYNYLINGGNSVNQRINACGNGTVASPNFITIPSLVLGTDKYSNDMWKVAAETAAATKAMRVNTDGALEAGLNAQHYLTLQANGTGKICVYQILEGINTLPLAGRSVVFQCKLKASSNKTLRLGLVQLNNSGTMDSFPSMMTAAGANSTDPTLGTNLAKIVPNDLAGLGTGTIVGSGVSCTATTAWSQFAASFTVPSNMKNIAVAVWTDSQFAANDTFSIGEAMLTDGEVTKDWIPRLITDELQLALRHCFTLGGVSVGAFTLIPGGGYVASGTQISFTIPFPVVMRVAPSFVYFGTIGDLKIGDNIAQVPTTTNPPGLNGNNTPNQSTIIPIGSTGTFTAGRASVMYWGASTTSALIFDAGI